MKTTLNLPPRHALELWGPPMQTNARLFRVAVLEGVAILALAAAVWVLAVQLAAKEVVVVRVDAVGRAEAVDRSAGPLASLTMEERQNVYRFTLIQFMTQHFARRRATVARDYPQSLLFLQQAQADALVRRRGDDDPVTLFVRDPVADETDIVVKNVTFSNLETSPYQAAVDYAVVTYPHGSIVPTTEALSTAQVTFQVSPTRVHVPVNPLGIEVLHVRAFKAF